MLSLDRILPDSLVDMMKSYTNSTELDKVLSVMCAKKLIPYAVMILEYVAYNQSYNENFTLIPETMLPVECRVEENNGRIYITVDLETPDGERDTVCLKIDNKKLRPCTVRECYLLDSHRKRRPAPIETAETAIEL